MAAIKASVNLFALLDGSDPGDKRLVDFESQLKVKDQPKKKPASAAAPGHKPKKEQVSKKPAAAASAKKKPTSSGFKSEKNSPAVAPSRKNLTPSVAASMARAVDKQTTPAPPAPPAVCLFAYPSARERIVKQRQEEFERRQAKETEKGGGVSGDDVKSADAGAPPADKKKGKTHGVRVQHGGGRYYDGAKQQPAAAVKEAPAPAPEKEPVVAPVVMKTPPPPPSIHDIDQFPSLK